MNAAQLEGFRILAARMGCYGRHRWEWIGPHMSQRMFGISEMRAMDYAKRFGGVAREMKL